MKLIYETVPAVSYLSFDDYIQVKNLIIITISVIELIIKNDVNLYKLSPKILLKESEGTSCLEKHKK